MRGILLAKTEIRRTGFGLGDVGRARDPRQPLLKKKRGAEYDISLEGWAIPQNIDEEVEQPNEAVKKIELPQQVIYQKSIGIMNQKLHRDNENKFKDQITADRVKISSLSVKVATLSAQVRRLREELSEARSRRLIVYKNKRPAAEVFSPAMELQTCTC
ncbi:uncharacterized protein A4U43_C09F4830 [Asparagus officinalis]|uniref:Uncharacterized protein n=1 Tax=Asparagus officinalis TaxID=4686 RepID=A0A5P1E5L4_ASPOF|nr:uncharacterized protein A4U43_C09F4830 [Asparagus officinalis]